MSNATKQIQITPLALGDKQALDILAPSKGHQEKTERLWGAIAPRFSIFLISGGNSNDFVESAIHNGTLVPALWSWAKDGKGVARKIGKAWAALAMDCGKGKKYVGKSCQFDQGSHDVALASMFTAFETFFVAPKAKEVASDTETPKEIIARLEGENARLKIDLDAALLALAAKPAPVEVILAAKPTLAVEPAKPAKPASVEVILEAKRARGRKPTKPMPSKPFLTSLNTKPAKASKPAKATTPLIDLAAPF